MYNKSKMEYGESGSIFLNIMKDFVDLFFFIVNFSVEEDEIRRGYYIFFSYRFIIVV